MKDDGGPAFPELDCFVDQHGEKPAYSAYHGMTLRDYFAGQALAGLCANDGIEFEPVAADKIHPIYARHAYGLADAMIAERSKD